MNNEIVVKLHDFKKNLGYAINRMAQEGAGNTPEIRMARAMLDDLKRLDRLKPEEKNVDR